MPGKKKPERRPRKPSGLNRKEKAEVKKIAFNTTQGQAEKKFMNPLPMFNTPPHYVNNASRISVLAFSNTVNKVGDTTLFYGSEEVGGIPNTPVEMKELKMLRPYQDTGLDLTTDNYTLEGRKCMPSSAMCKWRLSRNIGVAITQLSADSTHSGINVIPSRLATNLPIICRMIRVNPKLTQTDQVCDPETDLFVSPYTNSVTGVKKSDFDDLELLTYSINKRRYNVVQDKFFRIQNGLTIQYTKSTRGYDNGSAGPTNQYSFFQPIISNTNANCEKVLTTRHILTAKKHGQVFYNEPEGNAAVENASSGQKKEYILYHWIYAGAESFLDDENAEPKAPLDLRMSVVPCVKFTDI